MNSVSAALFGNMSSPTSPCWSGSLPSIRCCGNRSTTAGTMFMNGTWSVLGWLNDSRRGRDHSQGSCQPVGMGQASHGTGGVTRPCDAEHLFPSRQLI